MAELKKDLTSILELSKTSPLPVEGDSSITEELPREKVSADDFPDLDSITLPEAAAVSPPAMDTPTAETAVSNGDPTDNMSTESTATPDSPLDNSLANIPGLDGSMGSVNDTGNIPTNLEGAEISQSTATEPLPAMQTAAGIPMGDMLAENNPAEFTPAESNPVKEIPPTNATAALETSAPDFSTTTLPDAAAPSSELSAIGVPSTEPGGPQGPPTAGVSSAGPLSAGPLSAGPLSAGPAIQTPPTKATNIKGQTKPPPSTKQDLTQVKSFGEKLAIGKPTVQASVPFSLRATPMFGHIFDEKSQKAIEDALNSDDFGVRFEEIQVQMQSGKLLIPRMSEFAAITLAQKLRDVLGNIEIGPATDIFHADAEKQAQQEDIVFLDEKNYEQILEESEDLTQKPKTESEVFASTIQNLEGFRVNRIFSIITVSEVLDAAIAENASSQEFEHVTDRLTKLLVQKAFKIGANAVIGISFDLHRIEGALDLHGQPRSAYRLLGTGTAVQGSKI